MAKKSAREDMLKVTRDLFDKVTFTTEYTHENAIAELHSRVSNLTSDKSFSYVKECHELANIIETAIMIGWFGEANDSLRNR